jgi:serine/threonine-protein kinase
MASVLPSSLGRYEVLEELGKGAMGIVYLAKDPLIGRLVALKTFRAAMAMHGAELVEFRARFMREAQSAGILSHPNIVTIHDVVDSAEGGLTFIAMEYVPGTNLKEVLLRGEPLSLEQVVDMVGQVSEALDYAHSKGVIHRDIKPANIILDRQGQVKITDFGIARLETSDLTHEGQLLGTPNYMAPERILGKRVDHRTDIFSLGVVIYEMLTRQKPFQGENLTMVSHRIVYEPFTPPRHYSPGLPGGVVAILERALEKEPERRFAAAGELAHELRLAVAAATGSETRVTSRRAATPPPMPAPLAGVVPPPPPPAPGVSPPGSATTGSAVEDEAAADTQDVTPLVGRPMLPASRRQLPGAGRLLLVIGAAAASGLLLVGAAFGWLRWRQPVAPATDPALERRATYLPLLQQASTELAAGRPEVALVAVSRAKALAPDDPDLLRMEQRVQQAMATRQTAGEQQLQRLGLLQGAATALAARDPDRAAELARQVLTLAPGEPQAGALLAEAEKQIAERQQRELQRAQRPPPSAPARAAAAESAATTATEVGEVLLKIDFFTELPEGVLTIYAGSQKVLGERFAFYKRSGFFRNEPKAGRIEAGVHLPPGPTELRVYVALPREPPVVRRLEARLGGGSTQTLRIRFDRSKQLELAIE